MKSADRCYWVDAVCLVMASIAGSVVIRCDNAEIKYDEGNQDRIAS